MAICEEVLDNKVLCAILLLIRQSKAFAVATDQQGNELCNGSDFTFKYNFGGIITPLVTIQQEGDNISYFVIIRPVSNSNEPSFKEFKNLIEVPRFLFHAGEKTITTDDGKELTFAVARYDDEISHYDDNVRGRFMTSILNLRELLKSLPPDFLAPETIKLK